MTIFYLFLAIFSGFCMSLQSPTNATLSRYAGNLQATSISFGLLRTAKIKANSWRWAGMAVIALGVVIVAITKM